jgi:hypothetical protein
MIKTRCCRSRAGCTGLFSPINRLLGLILMIACAEALAADSYSYSLYDRRQVAEVFANGYPLGRFAGTNTLTISTLLEPYVVQGENVF